VLNQRHKFGQQTPRRWGWGTPLKKRTATRIIKLYKTCRFCQQGTAQKIFRLFQHCQTIVLPHKIAPVVAQVSLNCCSPV
jgi:hypothetical protein